MGRLELDDDGAARLSAVEERAWRELWNDLAPSLEHSPRHGRWRNLVAILLLSVAAVSLVAWAIVVGHVVQDVTAFLHQTIVIPLERMGYLQ